jgi:hypothetical protein
MLSKSGCRAKKVSTSVSAGSIEEAIVGQRIFHRAPRSAGRREYGVGRGLAVKCLVVYGVLVLHIARGTAVEG